GSDVSWLPEAHGDRRLVADGRVGRMPGCRRTSTATGAWCLVAPRCGLSGQSRTASSVPQGVTGVRGTRYRVAATLFRTMIAGCSRFSTAHDRYGNAVAESEEGSR